ncbi:NAD(P)-dependent alcohol dehydrogenase [Microcella alkalica]|uniref:NADPH:quinone reductase-like Zn-dependent oxidoreductase n=1 Tax=Microcella alkalica TaxID=355930 RepID=A0A839E5G3_9MICO|nr:NAD(P)-dependent alcohol dehydrogenase [Microcella alkalica]MBA8846586.1 NADPH:quinone reductase-like Zn-dependent oxidoreductase [Microcella alkalica]
MRAFTVRGYGGPEVLRVDDVPDLVPGEGEVVVRQQASSVNPLDWHTMRGTPYIVRVGRGLRRPAKPVLGSDISGVVDAVGPGVTRWSVGDAVLGFAAAAWAERVLVKAEVVVARPAGLDPIDAGGVGVAGITALQALTRAGVERGHRVLINGGSGGVGTFAVQIAKLLGAHVTATTSNRNLALVARIGADDVIDYAVDDVVRGIPRFDAVIDFVGDRGIGELRRVLTPEGALVLCGDPGGLWIRPIATMAGALVTDRLVEHRVIPLLATRDQADLQRLADWLGTTALRVVVDRVVPLADVAEAVAHVESRRARGKVLLAVEQ